MKHLHEGHLKSATYRFIFWRNKRCPWVFSEYIKSSLSLCKLSV